MTTVRQANTLESVETGGYKLSIGRLSCHENEDTQSGQVVNNVRHVGYEGSSGRTEQAGVLGVLSEACGLARRLAYLRQALARQARRLSQHFRHQFIHHACCPTPPLVGVCGVPAGGRRARFTQEPILNCPGDDEGVRHLVGLIPNLAPPTLVGRACAYDVIDTRDAAECSIMP